MKYRYLLKHKKFKFAAILSLIISAFSISLMYKESYTNKIEFNHNISNWKYTCKYSKFFAYCLAKIS